MHLPSINSHQSQILAEVLGSHYELKDEESLKIRSEKWDGHSFLLRKGPLAQHKYQEYSWRSMSIKE